MAYPLTALISDLHGNVPALQVALADAFARGARRFVCLGDVVGYGAKPRECLDVVMRLCVPKPQPLEHEGELLPGLTLRGNHEEALLGSALDFNPKARAAIDWTREQLNASREAGAYWDFLDGLAPLAEDELAMFAHGSPRDPLREYMLPRDVRDPVKMRAVFGCMHKPICFVGHSHVPAVYLDDLRLLRPRDAESRLDTAQVEGKKLIVNVGSVGQPRDGDPRLSYVLFDGRELVFVRLPYDHERAMAEIRGEPALPEYLAERLAVGR